MAHCRSCNAVITWAIMPSGSRIPLDAEPADNGNIVAAEEQPLMGELRVRPAVAGDLGVHYVSHFASCPQAPSWRR